MPRIKTEIPVDEEGNLLRVFSREKDKMVPVRVAVLKHKIIGQVPIEVISDALDPNDSYTPIRRVLIDRLYDWDPRTSCIRNDRTGCRLYDQLLEVSNRHMAVTTFNERKRILNPPEVLFLRSRPRFCQICLMEQHRMRKRENRRLRRFGRWLLRRK